MAQRQSLQPNPARLPAAVRGEGDGVNDSTFDDYFNSHIGLSVRNTLKGYAFDP